MKVISIDMSCYGSKPSGYFSVSDPGTDIRVELTETEAHELMAMALTFFEHRQASIAKSVADMKPLQLCPPGPVHEAEFTEV